MSNTNMRPEDRLAEKLKNDSLGEFFTEEDLLDIARKAINKAFFESRPNPNSGYGHPTSLPPRIVELADEYMREKIKTWVEEKWEAIHNDEEFQEQLGSMMVSSLGSVLNASLERQWNSQFMTNMSTHSSLIAQIVKRHS